ncbi:hypothetical protein F5Y03DRAFT_377090 [Xylaria venustula]|nr:hypothetical protein F5Y03DRAFT_377090 [Xylaria venustula]
MLNNLPVPPELVYLVCSFLSVKDILNFRLVNKFFADVGAAYMLPEVTFYLHDKDLDRLEAISLHPILSKHVVSLTYFGEVIDRDQVSWRDFAHIHRNRMRWDPKLRRANLKPSQVMAEFRKYRDAVTEQDRLLNGKRDFSLLKAVLPRFPRLGTLTMSTGQLFYDKPHDKPRKSPFPEYLHHDYLVGVHPEGKRPLDALLKANAHSPCALSRLRAGMVHWRFFKRSERELARMFKPLANLTSIELIVCVDPSEEATREHNSLRKCQQLLSKGAIRNILQHMPQLECLCLETISWEYDPIVKGAQLRDIIQPGFHWPNLKELVLGSIAAERTDTMDFLLLHKEKLRKLCLRDVTLTSTSWRILLPDIRENLFLEEACICGDIYGICEDEASEQEQDPWWDSDPMGPPYLEYWCLSFPGMGCDKMRNSVDMYCRQGGERYPDELPLCTKIVERHYQEYVQPFFKNDNGEDGNNNSRFVFDPWERDWEDTSDEELASVLDGVNDYEDLDDTVDEFLSQSTLLYTMVENTLDIPAVQQGNDNDVDVVDDEMGADDNNDEEEEGEDGDEDDEDDEDDDDGDDVFLMPPLAAFNSSTGDTEHADTDTDLQEA